MALGWILNLGFAGGLPDEVAEELPPSGAGNWNLNNPNRKTLKLKRGKTVREIQAEAKLAEIPKPLPLELFPTETEREIARLMREIHPDEFEQRLEMANALYREVLESQFLIEDEAEIELLMSVVLH